MAELNHGGQFSKKLRLEKYALDVSRRKWQVKIGKVHNELNRRPVCCLSKWVMLPSTCEFIWLTSRQTLNYDWEGKFVEQVELLKPSCASTFFPITCLHKQILNKEKNSLVSSRFEQWVYKSIKRELERKRKWRSYITVVNIRNDEITDYPKWSKNKEKKTGTDFIQDSKRIFTNHSLMCGQRTTIYSNYHEHYKINLLNVVWWMNMYLNLVVWKVIT